MTKLKIQSRGNYLIINNKDYYIPEMPEEDGDFNTGEWKWRKVNKKKIDKTAELLAEKLKNSLDPKIVLKDAIMALPEKDLEKLRKKLLKQKTKPKVVVKKHCVLMKVGGVEIPIR